MNWLCASLSVTQYTTRDIVRCPMTDVPENSVSCKELYGIAILLTSSRKYKLNIYPIFILHPLSLTFILHPSSYWQPQI